MTMPIPLPAPSTAERYSRLSVDSLRLQALERLYQRRLTLQNLINALEDYQQTRQNCIAECVDISSFSPMCSSDSAQSQI